MKKVYLEGVNVMISKKTLMTRGLASAIAVATALGMASPAMAADTKAPAAAESAAKEAAAINGEKVTAIDTDKKVITYGDGKTVSYDDTITLASAHNEYSLKDAADAVQAGTTVYVYNKYHAKGYGSVWNSNYDYTKYRTGVQIGEDSDTAIGADVLGAALAGTTLKNLALRGTSANFNAVVVNKSDAALDNPQITLDSKDTADGSNTNDFVGYGTAVTVFGDTTTEAGSADANGQMGGTTNTNGEYLTTIDLSNGGYIHTTGVAKPAVETDNGGDVDIIGDGNDNTKEISVEGGKLYDGFKNTADTVKMVSPPWLLGITGNARATNMLGKGGTMTVKNADVYAANWGVLSTDSGSTQNLYTINSNISMNTDSSKGTVSGYGTYAIGGSKEHFLGSTFHVATYATIATSSDNEITVGKTTKGRKIAINKAVWDDNKESTEVSRVIKADKTAESTINSENFGFFLWGGTTVNIKDASTLNTKSAAFLVKSCTQAYDSTVNISADSKINAASDANAEAEKTLNGTKNGVIYQLIDNEDNAAKGVSFPDGYHGPVFTDASFEESEGWQTTAKDTKAANGTETVNIDNKDLQGNLYNGSGYFVGGNKMAVNLNDGSSVTGAISATSIKHTTDGGKTQNTKITESTYNQFGHVMNKPYYNGTNDVAVTLAKGSTWNADGVSVLTSLNVKAGAKLNGTVYVNGVKTAIDTTKDTALTGAIEVVGAGSGYVDINKLAPTLAKSQASVKVSAPKQILSGKTAKIKVSTNSDGAVTYASSNAKVASVSSKGVITAKKAGKAKITVTTAATSKYKAASKTITVEVVAKPGKAVITKAKNVKGRKIALTYKASKAKGYEVQYSTSKTFKKGVKKLSTSKKSVTLKSLKKGRKYYVRVRAYTKVNSKKAYGSYSAKKTVTVKK